MRPTSSALLAALLAALLLPGVARAAHPLATDDGGTVGRGVAEVEVAGGLDVAEVPSVGAGIVLHAGLARRLDVGVSFHYHGLARPDGSWQPGLSEPVLDAKWRATDGRGAVPGLALRLDYAPPIGADGAHTGGAHLLATWATPRRLACVNAGATGGGGAWGLRASAMGLARVAPAVQIGGELVGAAGDGGPSVGGMGAGLLELPGGPVVSLGAGATWADGGVGVQVALGVTSTYGG